MSGAKEEMKKLLEDDGTTLTKRVVSDDLIEDALRIGRKDVVDYFMEHCEDYEHKRPVYHFRIDGAYLRAKLAEWGIEDSPYKEPSYHHARNMPGSKL